MKKHIVLIGTFIVLAIASYFWINWGKQLYKSDFSNKSTKELQCSITIVNKSKSSTLPPIICDYMLNGFFRRDTLVAINGQYNKVFSLHQPKYIALYAPRNFTRIFLAPGYKSLIKVNFDIVGTLEFEGDGNLENNYLRDVISLSKGQNLKVMVDNVIISPEYFFKKAERIASRRDSLYQSYKNIYNVVISGDSICSDFFRTEKEDNQFFLPRLLLSYAMSEKLSFGNRKQFFEKYINGIDQISQQVDSLSSENKRYFFSNLLSYYGDSGLANEDSSKIKKSGIYAYLLETAKNRFKGNSQSYLIDYNLTILVDFARSYSPEYPSIISLIEKYKSDLSYSKRVSLLRRLSDMKGINIPTEIIREYKMLTESGAEISLSQKFAPVTIVDIWATWCGPCVKSFPAMTKIKERYRNNDRVRFIWISIDENRNRWEAAIKKLNLDSDNSFWVPGGSNSQFVKDLDVHMLPRYLIIGENGKILETNAPSAMSQEKELISLIDNYAK